MATKRSRARRKAKRVGDLSVRANRATRTKGGIIIVNTQPNPTLSKTIRTFGVTLPDKAH